MEYKASRTAIKAINDRTVTGFFAIHGNVDDGGDRSHPGAFSDYTIQGRDRVVFLWNHGGGWLDRGQTPPIAAIKEIAEVGRDELPEPVLAWAPDATGGGLVTRDYLDTPRANEILAGIKAEAITEMSYAYDITKWTNTKTDDGQYIRDCFKMKLYDISDVSWGMNPATLGKKGGSVLAALPFVDHSDAVRAAVDEYVTRAGEIAQLREQDGRRLSDAHLDRLKAMFADLDAIKSRIAALLPQEAPPPPAPASDRTTDRLKAEARARRLRLMDAGARL